MTRARIRQAVRLFRNDLAPRNVRRHNARQWLAAIEKLGDRWLFARPVELHKQTA